MTQHINSEERLNVSFIYIQSIIELFFFLHKKFCFIYVYRMCYLISLKINVQQREDNETLFIHWKDSCTIYN